MLEGTQGALDYVVMYPTKHPPWKLDAAMRLTTLPHLDLSGDTSFISKGFPVDPHIWPGRELRAGSSFPSRCHNQLVCQVRTRGSRGGLKSVSTKLQDGNTKPSLCHPCSGLLVLLLIRFLPRKLGTPAQCHSEFHRALPRTKVQGG